MLWLEVHFLFVFQTASIYTIPRYGFQHFACNTILSKNVNDLWYCYSYSLADEVGILSAEDTFLRRVWTCPLCQSKLAVNIAEQLQHQAICKKEVEEALQDSKERATTSQDPSLLKAYNCKECGQTFHLTAIDILKHKREHARVKP